MRYLFGLALALGCGATLVGDSSSPAAYTHRINELLRSLEERNPEPIIHEIWRCGALPDGCSGECPVMLLASFGESGTGTGTVDFAGVAKATRFEVRGLHRRWDWCSVEGSGYACAFVMDVDGLGRYIDFNSARTDDDGVVRAVASRNFACARTNWDAYVKWRREQ